MEKIAWLIERDQEDRAQREIPEYLGFSGLLNFPITSGRPFWTGYHGEALRFAREKDAWCFIGILKTLYDELPSKLGLQGFRGGDKLPTPVEHYCRMNTPA